MEAAAAYDHVVFGGAVLIWLFIALSDGDPRHRQHGAAGRGS
ncbi:hypothetical protein [Methylobacterium sp. Leaf456]|nr:hypothetical protein [Methylobacterium sp. Leaf456]